MTWFHQIPDQVKEETLGYSKVSEAREGKTEKGEADSAKTGGRNRGNSRLWKEDGRETGKEVGLGQE